MFLWISVALPNTPSILSLASCSHLPVFPLMHYPSHIPWDSDRATNHSIDPTRGLSDWPSSWAHASRWPIRIFPWMFMYGYREKKNELSLGVGTTLLEDLRVSSTQSFLAWEAPNSTQSRELCDPLWDKSSVQQSAETSATLLSRLSDTASERVSFAFWQAHLYLGPNPSPKVARWAADQRKHGEACMYLSPSIIYKSWPTGEWITFYFLLFQKYCFCS